MISLKNIKTFRVYLVLILKCICLFNHYRFAGSNVPSKTEAMEKKQDRLKK